MPHGESNAGYLRAGLNHFQSVDRDSPDHADCPVPMDGTVVRASPSVVPVSVCLWYLASMLGAVETDDSVATSQESPESPLSRRFKRGRDPRFWNVIFSSCSRIDGICNVSVLFIIMRRVSSLSRVLKRLSKKNKEFA